MWLRAAGCAPFVSPTGASSVAGAGNSLTFTGRAGRQVVADAAGQDRPLDEDFSGFVFKIQANMNPAHRDHVAFVRVCSGHFAPRS